MLSRLFAGGCALVVLLAPAPALAAAHSSTIDATKAKKLAAAGVLTRADFRGYERERLRPSKEDDRNEADFYTCVGAKAPVYAARNRGYSYAAPNAPMDVETSADVARSVTAAKRHLQAAQSAKAPECLRQQLAEFAAEEGGSVSGARISSRKITVGGDDGAITFHCRATFNGPFGVLNLNYRQVVFLVGQTEITLTQTRYDGKDPGLKRIRSLTDRLVLRVQAI